MIKNIIEQFNITSLGRSLTFFSDKQTMQKVYKALIVDFDYWTNVEQDLQSSSLIKVTIHFKGEADIEKFLKVDSVYRAFENSIEC